MLRSTERILVTHVGSLPRPQKLMEVMAAEDQGRVIEKDKKDEVLREAVSGIVAKQVELGIDCVDDGEFSKRGFG